MLFMIWTMAYFFLRMGKAEVTLSAILVKAVAIASTDSTVLGFTLSLFQIVPAGGLLLLLCFPESIASACIVFCYTFLYVSP